MTRIAETPGRTRGLVGNLTPRCVVEHPAGADIARDWLSACATLNKCTAES